MSLHFTKHNFDKSGIRTATQSYFDEGELVANFIMLKNGKSLITVCYINVTDVYIPQFPICTRKRINPEFLYGHPPGTVGHAHDTGYMSKHVFMLHLKHFVHHMKPFLDSPNPIFLGNHASHI
jgi:hypothetical protein